MASWAKGVLSSEPFASWITLAPLSTAKTTPLAKSFTSETKLSLTLIGMNMAFGAVPTPPPFAASALESSASPVPWP